MKITVNGAAKEVPDGALVPRLLELLSLDPGQVAVEINRRIVRKADWPSTVVRPNDSIEVVTFVGGGSL
jgi:thiamine biosynthesis protein ThiS